MRGEMPMSVLEAMNAQKIVAIIRGIPSCNIISTVNALQKGGIWFAEITYRPGDAMASQDTIKSINLLRKHFGDSMYIGAGTVLHVKDVDNAYAAGAQFIISPNINQSVIYRTKELGMISMPGAYTPSEIEYAWEWGADIVKVFPADTLGPSYFKAVKSSMSHIKLSAVGGVTALNGKTFLESGADALGIGGNLVNPSLVYNKDWDTIKKTAESFVGLVKG